MASKRKHSEDIEPCESEKKLKSSQPISEHPPQHAQYRAWKVISPPLSEQKNSHYYWKIVAFLQTLENSNRPWTKHEVVKAVTSSDEEAKEVYVSSNLWTTPDAAVFEGKENTSHFPDKCLLLYQERKKASPYFYYVSVACC